MVHMNKKIVMISVGAAAVLILGIIMLINLHTRFDVRTYYYSNYAEAMNGNTSLSETWPAMIPHTVSEIHHETRTEPARTWMKFVISPKESEKMVSETKKLSDNEIRQLNLLRPNLVDWWFDELKQKDPDNQKAIEADVYVKIGECQLNPELRNTFIVIDKNSQNAYLWCDRILPF